MKCPGDQCRSPIHGRRQLTATPCGVMSSRLVSSALSNGGPPCTKRTAEYAAAVRVEPPSVARRQRGERHSQHEPEETNTSHHITPYRTTARTFGLRFSAVDALFRARTNASTTLSSLSSPAPSPTPPRNVFRIPSRPSTRFSLCGLPSIARRNALSCPASGCHSPPPDHVSCCVRGCGGREVRRREGAVELECARARKGRGEVG